MIRRWLKRLFWLSLILGFFLGLGYLGLRYAERWADENDYFEKRLVTELSRFVDGVVEVKDVRVDARGLTLTATDLTLRATADSAPILTVPSLSLEVPVRRLGAARVIPERIEILQPTLELIERADGTFTVVDMLRPPPPADVLPSVAIRGGRVALSGVGQVNRFLNAILSAKLKRHIVDVEFMTAPLPKPSDLMIGFTGTLALPGVARARLLGGIRSDGSFETKIEMRDLDLSGETLRDSLAPGLAAIFDRHLTSGMVDLTIEVATPTATREASLLMHVTGMDLALDYPLAFGDRRFEGVSLDLLFDGNRLFLNQLCIPDRAGDLVLDGVIDDVASYRDWRLTVRSERVACDDSIVSCLVAPKIRGIIDDYAPQGTFELFAEVSRRDGEDPRYRWRLTPGEVSASYVGHFSERLERPIGFPYRLFELGGELSGDNDRVEIRRLTGRQRGAGPAVVDGRVEIVPGQVSFDIEISAEQARLDDEELWAGLEHAAPGSRQVAELFEAEGEIDIDVRVSSEPGDPAVLVSGRVEARPGVRGSFEHFPVPVELDAGVVQFEGRRFDLIGIVGHRGATRVRIDGTLDRDPRGLGLDLHVSGTRVSARDAEFRAAVEQVIAKARREEGAPDPFEWDWLDPVGHFDIELDLKKDPEGQLRFRAVLFPRGFDVVPHWFAVPIKGVVGHVEFGNLHPDRPRSDRFFVDFHELEGRYLDATVHCSGRIAAGEPIDLRVRAGDVPLSPVILDEARRRLDAGGSDLGSVLVEAKPRGRASFDFRMRERDDAALVSLDPPPASDRQGSWLGLELHGVDLDHPALPGGTLSRLTGTVEIDIVAGRLEAERVIGVLADGACTIGSDRLLAGRGSDRILVTGPLEVWGLPINEELGAILPEGMRKVVAGASGMVDVGFDEMRIDLPTASDAVGEFRYKGRLDLIDCGMTVPLSVQDLSGRLFFDGVTRIGVERDRQVSGAIDGLRFNLAGLEFSEVTAHYEVDRNRIAVSSVGGDVADGSLPTARNTFEFITGSAASGDAESGYKGRLHLVDADLATLQRSLDDGFASGKIAGKVTIDFRFSGSGADLSGCVGGGSLRIVDGELWDLPVFAALYRFSLGLVLGQERKPTFETGEVVFHVSDGRVSIDELVLEALMPWTPFGLTLNGKGELGPSGMDLKVVPRFIHASAPVISEFINPIVNAFKRGLVGYRVHGPFKSPQVNYSSVATNWLGLGAGEVTDQPRLPPRSKPDWSAGY